MDSSLQSMGDMAMMQATGPQLATKIANTSSTANIDKAAENFEGMFVTQMLQPMFETVDVDPTFGGGHGEQIMRSFMVQEYGKIIAHSGKFGIASSVKTEMIKMQAAAAGGIKTKSPNINKGGPYAVHAR